MDTELKIDPAGLLSKIIAETFEELGVLVGEVNVANGWDTSRAMEESDDPFFPEQWKATHKIAELGLVMTEVSEAIEEVRHGRAMADLYYSGGAIDLMGFSDIEHEPIDTDGKLRKPEGVPSELADILIRVFDIADAYKINLGAAFIAKLNHNATRGLRHGGKAL